MTYQKILECYFLTDFVFRLLCSKYPRRMLGEFCSVIEIVTIVPFFGVWMFGFADIDHVAFRFCIMLVTSRVYLTKRIIEHMF